ncbi:Os04g0130966 [Oryza sativa Japonica Group]|uniref:Os04g0130966 protein n=1 Tax=Oryza sativa subsp. japonica TaxID=39947 RepID=A0A0P0W6M7_ORYSJ|nr:Os04g0130966 [Oryza sativa Japonica Group]
MESPTTSYSTTSAMERSNSTKVRLPTRSEPSSSTTRSLEIDQTSRRQHRGESTAQTSAYDIGWTDKIHPACIYKGTIEHSSRMWSSTPHYRERSRQMQSHRAQPANEDRRPIS